VSSEFGPLYQHGAVMLDTPDLFQRLDLTDCEFGVQVGADGRVWVCINGMTALRFKPAVITTVMVDDRHAKMLDDLPYVPFDQFSTDD
jgi:hypothetical protein